jgi:mannose-6-phosphate isomerase-like protein (cupin superfamily)
MDNIDKQGQPYVVDIEELTEANDTFRTTVWTGGNLQVTVMAIEPGREVGWETHEDTDQFLCIEAGSARVVMGPDEQTQDQEWEAEDDFAIMVPAGTWHNIINTGDEPLKLYSIYAPPHHPAGTVHTTPEQAAQ